MHRVKINKKSKNNKNENKDVEEKIKRAENIKKKLDN